MDTPKEFVVEVKNITGSCCVVEEHPEIEKVVVELVQAAGDLGKHLKASFELIPAGFWVTNEQLKGLPAGAFGYIGPNNGKPPTVVGDDGYMLTMVYTSLDNPAEIIASAVDEFEITKGPRGNSIQPLGIDRRHQWKSVRFAAVAKPEALKCLAILQEANQALTLKEFCSNKFYDNFYEEDAFSKHLANVIEIENGMDATTIPNVLGTWEKSICDPVAPLYDITIKLMAKDITPNINALGKLLTAMSGLRHA